MKIQLTKELSKVSSALSFSLFSLNLWIHRLANGASKVLRSPKIKAFPLGNLSFMKSVFTSDALTSWMRRCQSFVRSLSLDMLANIELVGQEKACQYSSSNIYSYVHVTATNANNFCINLRFAKDTNLIRFDSTQRLTPSSVCCIWGVYSCTRSRSIILFCFVSCDLTSSTKTSIRAGRRWHYRFGSLPARLLLQSLKAKYATMERTKNIRFYLGTKSPRSQKPARSINDSGLSHKKSTFA